MLNFKEILNYRKNNPEPKEVTEIREKILSTFNKLQFVEETHQYFLPDDNGNLVEYDCVSHVTHQFVPYSNWDEIAENYAIKHDLTKIEVQERWHYNNIKATNSGTGTHLYGEMWMELFLGHPDNICDIIKPQYQDGYLLPHSPKEEAVALFNEDLFRTPNMYPVLAETRVYTGVNKDVKPLKTDYAGTFDILYYFKHPTDGSKSGLLILDYKGLPLDTPIATKNGWTNMGDLQIGDEVFDKNGKLTKIVHVSSIHNNPCYKITFDDGEEIVADHEHRWLISFNYGKKIKEVVMTTEDIEKHLKYINKLSKKHAYLIPKIYLNKPLVLEKINLPIDPYLLGVWLGDGHSADGKITNMYDEVWDEIIRRGYKIGEDVSQGGSGKAKTRTVYGLEHELNFLNLLKNKHIPDIYLRSSYKQRLDVLRGFMDADGYYNAKRKRYVFATTKYKSVLFLQKLLATLSIKGTIIPCKKYCNDKIIDGWDICFSTDIYPFLVRKIDVQLPKTNKRTFRNIINVETVETVPTKCIEVDSPTHTFLAGYNMIVTHNTNHDLYKQYNIDNKKMLLAPFDDMVNQNLSIYTLQLSAYQIPLEDIGLKVLGRRIIWVKPDGTYEKISVPDVTKILREVL